jgi:DNA-binding transcriptional MerR regulator
MVSFLAVRTIREYHTMRLLPPPQRQGRVGFYGSAHVQRLQLIARLQRRGYSLAGIRDLLGAWESGSDLTTLLGVDGAGAPLDETPLRLTAAELRERLPAASDADLEHAARAGLVYPLADGQFLVRSPALLALVADGTSAGVPLGEMLEFSATVRAHLDALAGELAGLIVDSVWAPLSAAGRAGEVPDLFRRGRTLILQGTASTLADRLTVALNRRAAEISDGAGLRAALEEIRVGAVADAAGRIHRRGGQG